MASPHGPKCALVASGKDSAPSGDADDISDPSEPLQLPVRVIMPGELSTRANVLLVINAQGFDVDTVYSDVGGYEDAKQEVTEFANFLKDRGLYDKLGAKVPKGAILFGPPGTGKTLLARATAGEASVPFLACNSADFLLDKGVDKIKAVFVKARELSPCILFFDEIDCVGRARPNPYQQLSVIHIALLESLLTEMDGFDDHSDKPVIVLGATNDHEDIDQALLRPGRFDRMIQMVEPGLADRAEILQVHLNPLRTGLDKIALKQKLAYLTANFTGAKLFMLCNEAAMIAARDHNESVEWEHFEQALYRVKSGSSRIPQLSDELKQFIAYHDAGHAVCGWFTKGLDPPDRLAIMPFVDGKPTCAQLGMPDKGLLYTKKNSEDFLMQLMAGRASEELKFGEVTSQCEKDLGAASKEAVKLVTKFGMSPYGPVQLDGLMPWQRCYEFSTPISEVDRHDVLKEAKSIIANAQKRARELLKKHEKDIEKVATVLLQKQMLTAEDLIDILGPRPYPNDSFLKNVLDRDKACGDCCSD